LVFKRFHLFEFEDLGKFPAFLRAYVTDLLTYQINHFQIYKPLQKKFKEVLEKTDNNKIVDVCSGSGGPVLQIVSDLDEKRGSKNPPLSVYLTDKYPNCSVFKEVKAKHIYPIFESVDARDLPQKFRGFRTLFTSFHHFKPKDAKQILHSATNALDPIGVFEITERSLASFLTLVIGPLTALYFTFFLRPFTLGRLFWTYIIPVVPLLFAWDGLVSNLRSYTPEEMLAMAKEVDKEKKYSWEVGKVRSKFHILITYLIGIPKNKQSRRKQRKNQILSFTK